MKRLKSLNFVSGLRACAIFPLDRHEVLTRLPSANTTDSVNEFSFSQCVLEALKTNCDINGEKRKENKPNEGKEYTRANAY